MQRQAVKEQTTMNDTSFAGDASAHHASGRADGITWHVDEVPWTPLTGLFIKKAGYKTVVDAAFTDNAYSIELTTVGPGGSSPTHVEPHAHVFYVLSGVGEVTVGDEIREVRPGSVSPIAAGDPHSFRNTGGESLEMLVIYHPPRKRGEATQRANARIHEITRKTGGVLAIELRPLDGAGFP
ncbi:MAG: cupin domain-containing protein, partial [Rhizobacter sp.]